MFVGERVELQFFRGHATHSLKMPLGLQSLIADLLLAHGSNQIITKDDGLCSLLFFAVSSCHECTELD